MRFLGAMDWDEFEERGEERRKRRDFPPKMDPFTLVIGGALAFLVILWAVWGVMA